MDEIPTGDLISSYLFEGQNITENELLALYEEVRISMKARGKSIDKLSTMMAMLATAEPTPDKLIGSYIHAILIGYQWAKQIKSTIENSKPSISCQVCSLPATKRVDRTWHDGCLDAGMRVCNKHAESDSDGVWTMDNIVPL